MYGTPYSPYPFFIPQQPAKPTLADLLEAEKQIKDLKKSILEEDEKKKRDKKPQPVKVSVGTLFGALSIFSIPTVLLQIKMLEYAQHAIQNAFHITP